MRGEWGPKELQLALMGRLLFASQQATLIRAEARRRMSLQTGIAKEQRLATVDPRAEPKVIPERLIAVGVTTRISRSSVRCGSDDFRTSGRLLETVPKRFPFRTRFNSAA